MIKEIIEMANQLPKHPKLSASDETVLGSGLGYIGIRVDNGSDVAPEVAAVLVNGESVEVQRVDVPASARKVFKRDASAGLEKRLLRLAVEQGAITEHLADSLLARGAM